MKRNIYPVSINPLLNTKLAGKWVREYYPALLSSGLMFDTSAADGSSYTVLILT